MTRCSAEMNKLPSYVLQFTAHKNAQVCSIAVVQCKSSSFISEKFVYKRWKLTLGSSTLQCSAAVMEKSSSGNVLQLKHMTGTWP